MMDKVEQEASELACTEYLACMFIRATDQSRYGGLKTALDNQFLLSDEDKYPKTLSGALKFLKNYKVPVRYQPKAQEDLAEKAGLAFLQATGTATAKATGDAGDVACFGCGKRRSLKDCPTLSKAEKNKVWEAHNKQVAANATRPKTGVANLNVDKEKESGDAAAGAATPSPEDRANFDAFMQAWGVNMFNVAPTPSHKAPAVTPKVSFAEVVRTGQAKPVVKPADPAPTKDDRVTLCEWKLYLDSCATYH